MKCTRIIERRPLTFALAALFICLGVYSAVSAIEGAPPVVAAAAATVPALACYLISRNAFWQIPQKQGERRALTREARIIAAAAMLSGIVVATLGIALGAFDPSPSDLPLWPAAANTTSTTSSTAPSPALSLLMIIALCIFTGTYEEAVFSAVLFGGLRLYYKGHTHADSSIFPGSSLAERLVDRAALVQGVIFAFAHVAGGIIVFASAPSFVVGAQIVTWFVGTFFFGVVTAVLMERGRSLALNAAVHAVYDFALFAPLALKTGTLRATTVTGDASDLLFFSIQACVLAGLFAILYLCGRTRLQQPTR